MPAGQVWSSRAQAAHKIILTVMQKTYKQIKKLGRGAFGEVVLCRVVETGELVAQKRIYVRNASKGVPDNLVREIKSMQVICHPNVIELKDVYAEGSTMVLVLPYCVCDLARLIKAQHTLIPESIIKGLMLQMLRGVAACHEAGVMHRDLKPSNILLTDKGIARIADMGLARPMAPEPEPGGRPPQYTHTVATKWYRAPELLYGAREYGPAVDIWALGTVLAELLGLCPLIPGENDIDQLSKTIQLLGSMEASWPDVVKQPDYGKICFSASQPKPLQEVLPAASQAALDMLGRMIRCNPDDRPSAHELISHPFILSEPLPSPPHEIASFMERTVRHARELEQTMNRAWQALSLV